MYSAELLEVLKEIRDNLERIAKALEKKKELGDEYLDTKVKCEQCLWVGTYRECRFGHNDYCCPHCQVESLVEIK